MAGTLKPSGINMKEGTWIVNSANAAYGTGIINLFDSIRGTWDNGSTFYWNNATRFLDITLNQKSTIWAIGNIGYLTYNHPLKVEKWDGTQFVLLTNTPARVATDTWDKVIELEKGRYRFSHLSGLRMDDEWFIESLSVNRTLIQLNNGDVKYFDGGSPVVVGSSSAIPIMTSNTTPSGISSASTNRLSNEAWRAFNGAIESGGWHAADGLKSGWLKYNFNSKKIITKYSIANYLNYSISAPKDWTFEGSNTGVDGGWIILDTQVNQTKWTDNVWNEYSFNNSVSYLMYRINATTNNGHTSLAISELKMFEQLIPATPPSWKTLTTSTPNKSQFETYGYDDLSVITPKQWTDLMKLDSDIKLLTYVPTGSAPTIINATKEGKGLGLSAIPVPQFIHLKNSARIYGDLSDLIVSEGINNNIINNTRYLISPNKTAWYTWDGTSFVQVNTSVKSNILKNGMTYQSILKMQESQWISWPHDNLYVGVYLDDEIREKTISIVDSISYADLAPKYTTKVSDAKLYILNTISTINVTFTGKTINGTIDDADSGKVQYRILLNGTPYFPQSGDFTSLQVAPLNIALTLSNKDILIDKNNVVRVEFQDYWGATDYWETNFIGTYSGLIFKDMSGQYYSSDIGEVLKYLDFGIVIAGQTTIEQGIKLTNSYGYDVNNLRISVNKNKLPDGVSVLFGTNVISFESLDELFYPNTLLNGEELTFYIKLSTKLGLTKPSSGVFDIVVNADKV